ncbi:MAG: tetratricopeptide repeat protein [Phycisphaerales bacterium]|nr:tetratricopeptide repeat protein [Phycisphaerales bacterium]
MPTPSRSDVAIPLPVLASSRTVRPSRSSRRRAIVLVTIQLAMILHLVLWIVSRRTGWFGGRTLSPIEPSDSMAFVKEGVVNAGLVFFVIALLATLVFGRWFCGWGCHIVMLQDFCGWLMKRCGIRPRAFRSRLLMLVPLGLALYMFVWPVVYRWGWHPIATKIGATSGWIDAPPSLPVWRMSSQLITTDFWATFPGVLVAIPFFLVCGIASVYFLGAKGFCTYGCPYGGFFAPLDEFAPGRIRVTADCDQSGHCTAVCTSNVRVHDEVREYGMVVDPGCMKCLDCVSVCPNDALFYGFGPPAVRKPEPKHAAPRPRFDLTWPEEIALAVVFLGTFFAVRGIYGVIPMLMAGGIAGIVAFLAWKCLRIIRDDSTNLYRWRLKYKGRVRRSGFVFLASSLAAFGLVLHSGAVQTLAGAAARLDDAVTVPAGAIFSDSPPQIDDAMADAAARAIELYRLSGPIGDGGIAFAGSPVLDLRIAWLHSARLEFDDAEAVLRRAIARHGESEASCIGLSRVLHTRLDDAPGYAYADDVLARHPEFVAMADEVIQRRIRAGMIDEAFALCRRSLERRPDDLMLLRRLSLLEAEYGDLDRGIALIRRTIEIDSENPFAYNALALALVKAGRLAEAEAAMREALALRPDEPRLHDEMAAILRMQGRTMEAESHAARGTGAAP